MSSTPGQLYFRASTRLLKTDGPKAHNRGWLLMDGRVVRRCSPFLVLAALLLVGCGTHHASPDSATQSTVVIDTTPATETSTTEAPERGGGGGISVSVASLPIGGNSGGAGAVQCADVNLIGAPDPFPSDVTISVTGFSLDPHGVFQFGGDPAGCGIPNEVACQSSWTWSPGSTAGCLVTVTQVVDSEETVTLDLAGAVHCEQQASCDAITKAGGSQISFTAQPGVVSSSASESSAAESS